MGTSGFDFGFGVLNSVIVIQFQRGDGGVEGNGGSKGMVGRQSRPIGSVGFLEERDKEAGSWLFSERQERRSEARIHHDFFGDRRKETRYGGPVGALVRPADHN